MYDAIVLEAPALPMVSGADRLLNLSH